MGFGQATALSHTLGNHRHYAQGSVYVNASYRDDPSLTRIVRRGGLAAEARFTNFSNSSQPRALHDVVFILSET